MMIQTLLLLLLPAQIDPDAVRELLTREAMHERFTRATLVQTALINGDLDTARHWARQLAAMAPEEVHFADLRARFGQLAQAIDGSETVSAAAGRVAELANACGACHELHDVQAYRFESALEIPGGELLEDVMTRHIWAADRLWEGLIGRSERAWSEGAAILLEAPLSAGSAAGGAVAVPEALETEVRALGREALETARWRGRAEVYGKLLGTCASCHDARTSPAS